MNDFHQRLRKANINRQPFYVAASFDATFRGCELAGEMGELLDAHVLNTVAGALGVPDDSNVADEIGDVYIALDLCLVTAGKEPLPIPDVNPMMVDPRALCMVLAQSVGGLCNELKKYERSRREAKGSPHDPVRLIGNAQAVLQCLVQFAHIHDIDLPAATAAKFNATSVKLDIPVTLDAPEPDDDEDVGGPDDGGDDMVASFVREVRGILDSVYGDDPEFVTRVKEGLRNI